MLGLAYGPLDWTKQQNNKIKLVLTYCRIALQVNLAFRKKLKLQKKTGGNKCNI